MRTAAPRPPPRTDAKRVCLIGMGVDCPFPVLKTAHPLLWPGCWSCIGPQNQPFPRLSILACPQPSVPENRLSNIRRRIGKQFYRICSLPLCESFETVSPFRALFWVARPYLVRQMLVKTGTDFWRLVENSADADERGTYQSETADWTARCRVIGTGPLDRKPNAFSTKMLPQAVLTEFSNTL